MTTFGADPNFQKKLAAMLLQQGTDTSPIQHWTQGAARLAQALVGGNIMRAEREADQQNAEKIGQFLMAGQGGAPVAASPSITSEPLPTPATSPPASSRVYSENEFNPLDAAVATPKELAVGVPAPAQYAPTIGKAAVDNDIPPQLLAAQIKQESGFNPNAVSPAGAQGISQFMPGTAAEMGINPLDPNQAIPAGARYLRQQIDKFGGSIPHGLAAYNGGPGRLERAGGDISRMPAETRQYVQNVQQMAGGDPAALPPNATPTQGYAIPGQPSPQAIAAGLQNPNAGNPNRLAIAAQLLSDPRTPPHMRALIAQQMTPQKPIEVNGRLVDPRTYQVLADFSKPAQPTSDIQEYEYAKREGFTGNLTDFLQRKRSGAGEYGMQPIYGVGTDGKPVIMQLGKSGEAIQSKLPEGVTISKDPIKVDTGTHFILLDPVTRQPIGQPIQKNIAGAESAKVVGEAEGQAKVSLPTTESKAEIALRTIEQIRSHPGRSSFGSVGRFGWMPGIPGTDQKGFVTLIDQAKGQTFLQAFESLKGGGAITEAEGKKAEQALARLDRAQSDRDFDAALADYEAIIKSGVERARKRANVGMSAPAAAQTAPSVDDLLKKYGGSGS